MNTPLQQLHAAFPTWKISFSSSSNKYTATRKTIKGTIKVKCEGANRLARSIEKANADYFGEKIPCPVCRTGKDKTWHLVCNACWAKVPLADQESLMSLYKHERGSEAHVMQCRSIVRTLFEARRQPTESKVA